MKLIKNTNKNLFVLKNNFCNFSKLTLAGGDVNGLFSNSKLTKEDISLNSTGNVAIRLQLMSSETNCRYVTSEKQRATVNIISIFAHNSYKKFIPLGK